MITIIPAKLTSSACPAKNGRPLGGLSLIEQAICYARQEGTRPLIATPDGAVAALAYTYNVPVLYEPERGNEEGDTLALIRKAEEALKEEDYFSLLQPSSPFRKPGLLSLVYRLLLLPAEEGKENEPHGYFTARRLKMQGIIARGEEVEVLNAPRRQVNENWAFLCDGNIYAWKRGAVGEKELLTSAWDPISGLPELTHTDVDTEKDYLLAAEMAETAEGKKLLPAGKGLRIALVSNCSILDHDVSDEVDGHDLVVRVNDLRSLDTMRTGKRTDMAYILPGDNYLANNAESQHGDVLRSCRRVIFARQSMLTPESVERMGAVASRHGLTDNWVAVEDGTQAAAGAKTVLYEAAYHLTREYPECELTIYGDRHAGTRAFEHAGNIGQPEDTMMEELVRKYKITFSPPISRHAD